MSWASNIFISSTDDYFVYKLYLERQNGIHGSAHFIDVFFSELWDYIEVETFDFSHKCKTIEDCFWDVLYCKWTIDFLDNYTPLF